MKNSKEKIPDHLVDSCKRLSANWMAAGSRLFMPVMEIFLHFSNTPCVTSLCYDFVYVCHHTQHKFILCNSVVMRPLHNRWSPSNSQLEATQVMSCEIHK